MQLQHMNQPDHRREVSLFCLAFLGFVVGGIFNHFWPAQGGAMNSIGWLMLICIGIMALIGAAWLDYARVIVHAEFLRAMRQLIARRHARQATTAAQRQAKQTAIAAQREHRLAEAKLQTAKAAGEARRIQFLEALGE